MASRRNPVRVEDPSRDGHELYGGARSRLTSAAFRRHALAMWSQLALAPCATCGGSPAASRALASASKGKSGGRTATARIEQPVVDLAGKPPPRVFVTHDGLDPEFRPDDVPTSRRRRPAWPRALDHDRRAIDTSPV